MAVDPKAIAKAKSRLRVAEKSLSELSAAKSHTEFSDSWYTYLLAAKNVYTALEQGSKLTPQDRQWFGDKKNERRTDQLLQYLFQARDDDEHGIEEVTEFDPGGVGIGVAREDFSQSIHIKHLTIGPNGVHGDIRSMDGKPILIKWKLPHTKLATVTGRGPVRYPPPTNHQGKKLESNLPIEVGRLALDYLTSLVAEAEGRA